MPNFPSSIKPFPVKLDTLRLENVQFRPNLINDTPASGRCAVRLLQMIRCAPFKGLNRSAMINVVQAQIVAVKRSDYPNLLLILNDSKKYATILGNGRRRSGRKGTTANLSRWLTLRVSRQLHQSHASEGLNVDDALLERESRSS